MPSYKIAVIPGDGIGPEVTREALKVLSKIKKRLGASLEIEEHDIGAARYLKSRETLPDRVLEKLRGSDAILLGAVGDPKVPPGILERDILLRLRFELDLYINLRPCALLEGAFTPLKNKSPRDIDFAVVRENSEGLYAGIGGTFKKGTPFEVAVQEDINARAGVERALRYAFETARTRGPKKHLALVDKANVLTHAHGLWRRTFEEVAGDFPGVRRSATYVDAAAMDLVRRPEIFDVVVTNNLFGDILTDLGAVISGGLGLAASANLNPGPASKKPNVCRGLFEPVHGSAPDIAGKGTACPPAAILAAGMMLDSRGERSGAAAVGNAVGSAVRAGRIFKKDSFDLALSTS